MDAELIFFHGQISVVFCNANTIENTALNMLAFGERSTDKQLHCKSIPLPHASLTVLLVSYQMCNAALC